VKEQSRDRCDQCDGYTNMSKIYWAKFL
jgi:hypothetical protein